MRNLLLVAVLPLLLVGCVSRPQPLYYWGDFQAQQYAYFKGTKGPEDQIIALEKIREEAKSKGTPLPPGLQAHLGILYGATGRTDQFLGNLEAEKQQFPESATFMDFLSKRPAKK